MGTFFDRTIVLCKENGKDGKPRIRRIPFDLLSREGYPFMVSPMPVGEVDFSESSVDFADLIVSRSADNNIDDVTDILWVKSEQAFFAMFDNVFAMYNTDNPSDELGYPRTN